MAFRKLALATAAIGLAASPVMAEASAERAQPVAASSEVGDFAGGNAIFYILGLAAVIAGVILIADGDDDDALSA